jgi:hypothetical protein
MTPAIANTATKAVTNNAVLDRAGWMPLCTG